MKRYLCLLGALCFFGCEDNAGSGSGCTESRECPLPTSCIEGKCIEECRRTSDCPRHHLCIESECLSPVEGCLSDLECAPFEQICDEIIGRCAAPGGAVCHDSLNPCPAGQMCTQGACQLPSNDAAQDAALPQDASFDTASLLDAAPPPPDAALPQPDASPPAPDMAPDATPLGMGQYGEDCQCGADCASGACVQNKLLARRICTDRCGNDGECPGLAVCLPVQVALSTPECPGQPDGLQPGEIISVCVPNDTGFPCSLNGAQNPCNSGVCLRPPQPAPWINVQDQCAMFCEDDRKCPHGYSCQETPGVNRRICAPEVTINACPLGTINECGGTCAVPAGRAELDITLCLGQGQGGPGYCSCTCDSALDCPQGFACSAAFDTGDLTRPKICLAMAGYRCPAEVQDPQAGQCPSLTCLLDADAAYNSVCTAACGNEMDCPPNFGCQAVGDATFCVAL